MRKLKGSISVYFVLCITLIISVILSVTELSRITCQKLYLTLATNTSIDSMMSLYHRKLYEYYNVYGVEYRTNDMLTEEYLSYLSPYFIDERTNKKVNNWYTAEISKENIIMKNDLLIDKTFLEKEILEYMKYKIIGKAFDFLGKTFTVENEEDKENFLENTTTIFNDVKKSELYSEVYTKYFDFADDIKILESYAKKVPTYIRDTNNDISTLKGISTSGQLSNAKDVSKKVKKVSDSIIDLVDTLISYQSKMADFREVVNNKRAMYENDKTSGIYEMNDDICEFIESEFDEFLSYVDAESEMNRKVEYKISECEEIKGIFDDIVANTNHYVSELESIEEQLKEEKAKHGDERDSDLISDLNDDKKDTQDECRDYFKEIKEDIKSISIEIIELETSTGTNTSGENALKKLINFKNGLLLNLVLDNDEVEKISTESDRYNKFSILSDNQTVSLNKILLGEYELDKFNYYTKSLNDEITKSGSEKLEVEQLLYGKNSDLNNIKSTIDAILLIRIAMNVLHIYKSSEKRHEARTFAYTIFGGFSRLLAEVMFLMIISAWGTAQAIVDVKRLLKNQKVNFMHDDSSWSIDVGSIISIANGSNITTEDKDDDGMAFSYKDYLRILLMLTKQSEINERMVAIMEQNIKKDQESFDFEKLVSSFSLQNTFTCKHFFTNFLFIPAKSVKLYNRYVIKTSGYKSFIK